MIFKPRPNRLYSRWILTNSLETEEERLLLSQTRLLRQIYTEYIQIEETIVFPESARALGREATGGSQPCGCRRQRQRPFTNRQVFNSNLISAPVSTSRHAGASHSDE